MDLVFPQGNEKEFLEIASKLEINDLVFVYSLDNFKKVDGVKCGVIVDSEKQVDKAKKLSSFVIIKANEDKNRHYLEKSKVDMVFDFEASAKEDFLHSRRGGLNHITARIAHDKGKMVGFSFSSVLNSFNRPRLLGRVMQNIKLCRKYKVKVFTGSFATNPYGLRSSHDLKAFFITLGMEPKEAQEARKLFK